MTSLVIIPTYNEKDNIVEMIQTLRAEVKSPLDILVVDSASPDKTAETVQRLKAADPGLFLLEQPAKLGLGKAYIDGMTWALNREPKYHCVITMDADFSHHPRYLDRFIQAAEDHELVIGSRYVPQGKLLNWPWYRQILSRFANGYACLLTGLPFHDLTSGFHCFRTGLLRRVLRYDLHTEGYAFLIELKFLSILQGARHLEVPILFSDRTRGSSKISKKVIWESMVFVLARSLQRRRVRRALAETAKSTEVERTLSCR